MILPTTGLSCLLFIYSVNCFQESFPKFLVVLLCFVFNGSQSLTENLTAPSKSFEAILNYGVVLILEKQPFPGLCYASHKIKIGMFFNSLLMGAVTTGGSDRIDFHKSVLQERKSINHLKFSHGAGTLKISGVTFAWKLMSALSCLFF